MNESKKEHIKSYFYKKLSEAEKKEILAEIEASEELKSEFENLKLLKEVAERNRILEQTKRIHEVKMNELKRPKNPQLSVLKVTSSAVAACLAIAIYLGNADFSYLQISSIERGEIPTNTALVDIENGINLLKNGEPKIAFEQFQKAKNDTELTQYYRDAAQWYETVCLAEMNKDEEAKIQLNKIENSTGFKYKIGWIEKLKINIRLWF